ncbi:MAG TPA: hypothetical protein VGG09_03980 [Acidimicrobiales bacterium]|jgi:hypothetical protein
MDQPAHPSQGHHRHWPLLGGVVLVVLITGLAAIGSSRAALVAAAGDSHLQAGAGEYGAGSLMAADPTGGYWISNGAGAVRAYGGAATHGEVSSALNRPVVGMAPTASGDGYWLVATDGGVFSYGDASFYGSTGSIRLNQPIVGMAPTPDGDGYWLVAADGGIFSYGDASFFGSTGSLHLNQPIVGMAPTSDGGGYWLVAADGGIFTFGDASFYGSTGSLHLNRPMVGMAPTPDGDGYWLVAADGGIFTFGDARFNGSLGGEGASAAGLVVAPSTGAYSIVEADGDEATFAPPPPVSDPSSTNPADGPSVAAPAFSGIGGTPQGGDCVPEASPTVAPDPSLSADFADQRGPGWVGGDATYSTELPDGRIAFAFSDTLIGMQSVSGAAALTGVARNSELVGPNPASLSSDFGGSYADPAALVADANASDNWEVASTYVENGAQLIFLNEYAPIAGTTFEAFSGISAIAVMSVTGNDLPTLASLVHLPTDADTSWGTATFAQDGYHYVYGLTETETSSSSTVQGMKVARVPVGETIDTAAWTYWSGSSWVSAEAGAAVLATVNDLTGVVPQAGDAGYVALSIASSVYTDNTLDVSYACSPTGPWSTPTSLFTIPEVSKYQDEIAYIPTFHPELSSGDSVVVSYNIDSADGLAPLEADVHQYQPQFLTLSG